MHVSTIFIFVSIQLEKINIKATAFNYNHLLLSKGMILKLSICRVHMNLFYLLKTPIYADGVTNGAINIDTKEKPVSIILPQKLIGLNIHVK